MERRLYSVVGFVLLATVVYFHWASAGRGGWLGLRIPIPWLQPRMGFIRRNGTHFVEMDGTPVYFNGWNSYWLMTSESEATVSVMLKRGRAMGMNVCRTWAFSDGGSNALQIYPGRFNERVFQALDFVIYEARRNNIRLILCLVNNLNAFGGKAQYVRWAQAAGVNVTLADSFFSHPNVKQYYRDYVKNILTRKNSYSGVTYKDEPAIFAWELINEPRCLSNSCAPFLQAWIAEMASYIKTLDQKHLITIGLEGFYGHERTKKLGVNPGKWAGQLGSDFIQNSFDKNIDFASVHAYPDSWIPKADHNEKIKYLSNWVDSHLSDGEYILKKPVLFSEIGSWSEARKNGSNHREVMLKVVYDKVFESASRGQAGAGALVWQLMVEGTQRYEDEFSFVAGQHPDAYKLILQQSCRLRNLLRRKGKVSKEWPCSNV
ncbi:hypothetical protein HPP92_019182 [Vanilla planifolia]|uniref:mannan endo-1,4-beta-mannosidase n=1 Tax=Vanilla planifolia TaxID=51239 RepID=A0A835Q9T6_VANPL|nr:hypothetical protein HPP92_019182 [Vanilla planifolia]